MNLSPLLHSLIHLPLSFLHFFHSLIPKHYLHCLIHSFTHSANPSPHHLQPQHYLTYIIHPRLPSLIHLFLQSSESLLFYLQPEHATHSIPLPPIQPARNRPTNTRASQLTYPPLMHLISTHQCVG